MEALKTTTSYAIIQRLQGRFKFPSGNWHGDAIDWIGEGIKQIGYHVGFVPKDDLVLKVSNYAVKVPAEVESLNGIYYKGTRLPVIYNRANVDYNINRNYSTLQIANDANILDLNSEYKRLKELQELYIISATTDILDAIIDTQSKINLLVSNMTFERSWRYLDTDWYGIEGGFIKTSFSDGEITLDANCHMLDDRGFPMVVDTQKYLMAIEWFIVYNLMLQGMQHPVITFEFVYNECFNVAIPAAQNEPKMLSIDKLENFDNSWNSVKRNNTNVTYKSDI